jgi:hypothetical protein
MLFEEVEVPEYVVCDLVILDSSEGIFGVPTGLCSRFVRNFDSLVCIHQVQYLRIRINSYHCKLAGRMSPHTSLSSSSTNVFNLHIVDRHYESSGWQLELCCSCYRFHMLWNISSESTAKKAQSRELGSGSRRRMKVWLQKTNACTRFILRVGSWYGGREFLTSRDCSARGRRTRGKC